MVEFSSFQWIAPNDAHALLVGLHHDLIGLGIAQTTNRGQAARDKFALVEGIVEQSQLPSGAADFFVRVGRSLFNGDSLGLSIVAGRSKTAGPLIRMDE